MQIWISGVRQNRLARELKVDETVLSKVINGYRQPSPELRALLAQYFNKSETWLFQTGAVKRAEDHAIENGRGDGSFNHRRNDGWK